VPDTRSAPQDPAQAQCAEIALRAAGGENVCEIANAVGVTRQTIRGSPVIGWDGFVDEPGCIAPRKIEDDRTETELLGLPLARRRRVLAHNDDRKPGELGIIAVVERTVVGECCPNVSIVEPDLHGEKHRTLTVIGNDARRAEMMRYSPPMRRGGSGPSWPDAVAELRLAWAVSSANQGSADATRGIANPALAHLAIIRTRGGAFRDGV
jgi:hypothetical protein